MATSAKKQGIEFVKKLKLRNVYLKTLIWHEKLSVTAYNFQQNSAPRIGFLDRIEREMESTTVHCTVEDVSMLQKKV